jgi:hypothetical protein
MKMILDQNKTKNRNVISIFGSMLTIFVLVSIACNFPGLGSSPSETAEEITTTIGIEGGTVMGPGEVELIVPEGALSQQVEINLSVGGDHPKLPEDSRLEVAGKPVEVILPSEVSSDKAFELIIPFERDVSATDDQYSVLRWDGSRWGTAGGFVEGDRIRVWTNQFSIFMPTRTRWITRPVSFVNDGPYDAVVMPWTYQPLDPFAGVLPPGLSTVSFAPGGPGLWPNPSRFLGLPLGTYTFCVEWDEDQDLDNDGYIDYYHYLLEGPSVDLPLLVDENDPIDMTFAEEVRFRTDPIDKLEGKCAASAASQWSVRLIPIDVRTIDKPPVIIAFANVEYESPPESVSITSQGELWRYDQVTAMMRQGEWISATCNDPNITTVGLRIAGDANDGWGRVLVDGQEVWRGNAYGDPDAGGYSNYLEVSGLDPGSHTIQAECLGIPGDGGGIHFLVHYFAFSTSPVPAP